MSTDYSLVCYTCQCSMPGAFASGSGFYGYKVWDGEEMREWLGHGKAVGLHEGHDLRIVGENTDLPWESEGGPLPPIEQVDGNPARGYIPPASMTGAAGASDTGRCCGVARRSPAGRFTFEGEQ